MTPHRTYLNEKIDQISRSLTDAYWFIDANLPENLLQQVAVHASSGQLIANAVSNTKAPRLRSILPTISYLMLNRGEAISLTGRDNQTSNTQLITALLELGANDIVLTDGGRDLLIATGENVKHFTPADVDVLDVTGAGDALTAGTTAALVRGYPLIEAIPVGLAAAKLTLQSAGALADNLCWEVLQNP